MVLHEYIRLVASSGGIVNVDKLKAFKVVLQAGKLALLAGSIDTTIGPLPFSLSSLEIVGAPALMGSDLTNIIATVRDRMVRLTVTIKVDRPVPWSMVSPPHTHGMSWAAPHGRIHFHC